MISGGARSRGRSKSSPRPQPSDVAAHTQPVLPIEFAQAKKAPDVRHVLVAQVEFVNIHRLHNDPSVPSPMMIHAEIIARELPRTFAKLCRLPNFIWLETTCDIEIDLPVIRS